MLLLPALGKATQKKGGDIKGFLGISQVETQVAIAGESQPLAAMLQQPLPISCADEPCAPGECVGTHEQKDLKAEVSY